MSAHDRLSDARKGVARYHAASPGVASAFAQLHEVALASGALDRATKELMATAIAIVHDCDGCVSWHLQAAADAGATREMAVEALDVAVVMGGGPSVLLAGEVLAKIDAVFNS